MTSVDTASATRDEHLRSADFLEVATYPTMSYRSAGVRPDGDGFVMDGELTLKGITRPVPLRLEASGFGADPLAAGPAPGARAGFTATGVINRMDFGVSYNGPIPGGGVLLGEEVQIILEIEAVLQTTGLQTAGLQTAG
jgi:polyisoprenoid-binding protein YceI